MTLLQWSRHILLVYIINVTELKLIVVLFKPRKQMQSTVSMNEIICPWESEIKKNTSPQLPTITFKQVKLIHFLATMNFPWCVCVAKTFNIYFWVEQEMAKTAIHFFFWCLCPIGKICLHILSGKFQQQQMFLSGEFSREGENINLPTRNTDSNKNVTVVLILPYSLTWNTLKGGTEITKAMYPVLLSDTK